MQHIYRVIIIATLLLCSGTEAALLEGTPDLELTPEYVQAVLLKLANEKICDPESEMYCEAHTAFVFKNDAVVLLSVQPTAGLFMIFQKDMDRWTPRGTYRLLDYEKTLTDSALSKAVQEHFIQAFTAYVASREKSK